jgi:hypothetical protein
VPDIAETTLKVGDGIDKLCSIEITGRGVIGALYAAARERQGRPLTLLAAERLLERVGQGDAVVIATGLPTFPWFLGEQDGPVGAATLARALLLGPAARPMIVTEDRHVEMCKAALRGAGLYPRGMEEALRLPTTAAVVPFTTRWENAEREADQLLDRARPKALVAIERPGANEHGRYHAAKGFDFSEHCAKVDVLFERAKARGILTIGIGDGGNELGCALIRDAVIREVPYGKKCQCPCGGTVVPRFVPDVLLGRAEVMHSREVDRRAHELCAAAEANNDGPGLLDPGTDAVPMHLHGNFVELLQHMVQSGLDFGRLYKEPRYPWLHI